MTSSLLLASAGLLYIVGSIVMHKFAFDSLISTDTFPEAAESKQARESVKEAYNWLASIHVTALIWPVTLVVALLMFVTSLLRAMFTAAK